MILLLTRERADELATQLLQADAAGDAERLAQLSWELLAMAGTEHSDAERLRATLHTIATSTAPLFGR